MDRLLIRLLGGFRLVKKGHEVALRSGGRTEALLSALALGPRRAGVAREALLELVWPTSEGPATHQGLNTLVYALHRSFGDALDGQGPVVRNPDGRYRLNVSAGVVVDVDRFDDVIDAADRLARRGEPEAAMSRYLDAATMYEGDLVIGSDLQHVVERERLRARFLAVRALLAVDHLEHGENDAALAGALELLAFDPCREDAHRIAMRCYMRLGQRAQALRQYRVCREILEREFDAVPERATDELFELVRLDRLDRLSA